MALGYVIKVALVIAGLISCRHSEVAQSPLQQVEEPVKTEPQKVDTSICAVTDLKESLDAIIDAVDAENCAQALEKLAEEEVIDLSHLQIRSAAILSQLHKVRELDLGYNQINSLKGLGKLKELRVLTVDNNKIRDLEELRSLKNLVWLNVAANQIEDVSPLSQLPNLVKLDLTGNKVRDLSPLKDLVNLSELQLEGNPIAKKPATCPSEGRSSILRQFCAPKAAH